MEEINVLSCFDGMSCGQIALKKAEIKVKNYFASEIKKHAIKVTQHNFPNTIQVGSVEFVSKLMFPNTKIDLLIGGSPCQNISNLRPGENIEGDKSRLFFEFLRLKNEFSPKWFLLENVNGDKESLNTITKLMGVEPVRINSQLLSFQKRDRIYWTNIPFHYPSDLGVSFQDYKEIDLDICESYKVNKTPSREIMWQGKCPNVTERDKINCLTVKQDRWNNAGLVAHGDFCRYLTVKECELAQTVPVGYCDVLTRNQAYDVLGDGWTVDVIAEIFKGLNTTNE